MGYSSNTCVDDAVLTRAAHDAGVADLGLDDCAFGEQVPAHIVRVCRVLLTSRS